MGAPILALGGVELAAALVRHGEVVQGVGEVELIGPEGGFLRTGGLTEQAGRGGEVAAQRRLLGGVEQGGQADRIGHGTAVLQASSNPRRPYSAAFFSAAFLALAATTLGLACRATAGGLCRPARGPVTGHPLRYFLALGGVHRPPAPARRLCRLDARRLPPPPRASSGNVAVSAANSS